MLTDAKITAARAFLRSLNILLKFARLYGFEHSRTAQQFQTAWSELQAALPADNHAGLLLGATGSQLLLDGMPLGVSPVERSFAQLLSAAGVASIHFLPHLTRDDLARLVRAFPTGGAKPSVLAQQLKSALAGATGIRVNEVRFVAEDASLPDTRRAAQITAAALGGETAQLQDWLNDPQKLLQLLAAAQGAKGGLGGGGGGKLAGGPPGSGPAPPVSALRFRSAVTAGMQAGTTATAILGAEDLSASIPSSGLPVLDEGDLRSILVLFKGLAQANQDSNTSLEPLTFQQRLSALPVRSQYTLQTVLAGLAAQAPTDKPHEPLLIKLAEHLAIQFALERYERGEIRVNAVRELLDRMGQEMEALRKILGSHEEKLARAGIAVESHTDLLDRQFWAAVPESGKKSVLLSPEAWCIPPRNIRQYIEELQGRGDMNDADQILLNYASCVSNPNPDARRKTAIGINELAELYTRHDSGVLTAVIRQTGAQLCAEREPELQSLVSAAFVRLSQEAGIARSYSALRQAMDSVAAIEVQRPTSGQALRPRIAVETRLPEFIEEALRVSHVPQDLTDVLRLMPQAAMDYLNVRLNRSGYRQDCDRLVELARSLGPDALAHLRGTLRVHPAPEAVETVGMLSRLDPAAVEEFLPGRLREWQRSSHDRAVRLLTTSGAPERGSLLLSLFDTLDPLIMSLALDEIGMTGGISKAPRLLSIAQGSLPDGAGPYLRLKAIEALGRLRSPEAEPVLRKILEAKQVWRWAHPSELRIAAAQAMEKIDPAWLQSFLPQSGLNDIDLSLAPLDAEPDAPWFRQRRYQRIHLNRLVAGVAASSKESCRLEIKGASLSGGGGATERHLPAGTQVTLKLSSGLRGLRATVLMRDYRTQEVAFEIVDMDLEERSKFRRLLIEHLGPATATEQGLSSRRAHRQHSAPR